MKDNLQASTRAGIAVPVILGGFAALNASLVNKDLPAVSYKVR